MSVSVLLVAGCAAAASPAPGARSVPQATARTVHVTVTQKDGTPATDLRADEFEVKYAGKTAAVTGVKMATSPLRVALLVADRGTGMFQAGALRFIEALLGRGEFSITGVLVQPQRYMDYSGTVDSLRGGLIQLQRRGSGNQTGAQLVEAIVETVKEIPREGYRPVIVVLRAGGEAPTPIRSEMVREELRKSGAVLYAISRSGTQSLGGGTSPTQVPSAAAVSYAAATSEVMEGALTLGSILGDGSRDSGGRHLQAVSTTIVPVMQQIAAELLNQYEVSYVIPEAGRPSDRLAVSIKRRGLTVAAPTRVPN
jgi:hypothetical protein